LPLSQHTGMSLAAGRFPVLAMNAPYASIGQEYVSHSTNPIRSSQNSLKAKFAEYLFHALG
jgi:hypothetical protein